MDYQRANEILNSPETIDVTYNGANIWIKSLTADHRNAVVAPASEGEPDITVALNDLNEL